MKLALVETAELELDDAMPLYRARDESAAVRFIAEIVVARDKIIANPNAWHPLGDGIRRYRLNRFPYG